ncbi:FAD-dependent oxidoreductase [bacterium]|nr:FAD-dependent oxidoreductase [bacterium]
MYDLAIVGGGPAGVAAAVYAARKRLKTILITDDWGGQSTVSPEIQNWIGDQAISGADLAKKLRAHVEAYKGEWLTIVSPHRAKTTVDNGTHITITCSDSSTHEARTLLIATGSNRRKLEIPGAAEYDNKGLTYCASCDGPLFADMDVAVIGGGNAAFETAMQLLAYCKTVTLFNRSETFRADELTVEKVLAHPKMRVEKNSTLLEVTGEKFVNGLRFKNAAGEEKKLDVAGIFVEIGLVPNTDWVKDVVKMNEIGQIIADPYTQRTSNARIWAAGDCTDGKYHQNNIAAGDAVKALEDIYAYVHMEKDHQPATASISEIVV